MTKEELIAYDKDYVYAKDICELFNVQPQAIREQAKAGMLPCIRSGNRTKILRIPFLKMIGAIQ